MELIQELSVDSTETRHKWFKIAIAETKDGWVKIDNILVVPSKDDSLNQALKSLKNTWTRNENLKINIAEFSIPDSLGVPFYQKPNTNAIEVCRVGEFLKLSLIATDGLWAKVSFIYHQTKYVGWIENKHQCAYPWTSCP